MPFQCLGGRGRSIQAEMDSTNFVSAPTPINRFQQIDPIALCSLPAEKPANNKVMDMMIKQCIFRISRSQSYYSFVKAQQETDRLLHHSKFRYVQPYDNVSDQKYTTITRLSSPDEIPGSLEREVDRHSSVMTSQVSIPIDLSDNESTPDLFHVSGFRPDLSPEKLCDPILNAPTPYSLTTEKAFQQLETHDRTHSYSTFSHPQLPERSTSSLIRYLNKMTRKSPLEDSSFKTKKIPDEKTEELFVITSPLPSKFCSKNESDCRNQITDNSTAIPSEALDDVSGDQEMDQSVCVSTKDKFFAKLRAVLQNDKKSQNLSAVSKSSTENNSSICEPPQNAFSNETSAMSFRNWSQDQVLWTTASNSKDFNTDTASFMEFPETTVAALQENASGFSTYFSKFRNRSKETVTDVPLMTPIPKGEEVGERNAKEEVKDAKTRAVKTKPTLIDKLQRHFRKSAVKNESLNQNKTSDVEAINDSSETNDLDNIIIKNPVTNAKITKDDNDDNLSFSKEQESKNVDSYFSWEQHAISLDQLLLPKRQLPQSVSSESVELKQMTSLENLDRELSSVESCMPASSETHSWKEAQSIVTSQDHQSSKMPSVNHVPNVITSQGEGFTEDLKVEKTLTEESHFTRKSAENQQVNRTITEDMGESPTNDKYLCSRTAIEDQPIPSMINEDQPPRITNQSIQQPIIATTVESPDSKEIQEVKGHKRHSKGRKSKKHLNNKKDSKATHTNNDHKKHAVSSRNDGNEFLQSNIKVVNFPNGNLTLKERLEMAEFPPNLFSDVELEKLGLKKVTIPKKRKKRSMKKVLDEKPAVRKFRSAVQQNLVQLLRFQVAEGLVERECDTCFEARKNCCCCPDCGLCCHCVCQDICAANPATQRQALSRTEMNVLGRLGRCHQCEWPLCSQAFLAFLTFNSTVNEEELLQQHMNQCWNDVIYLICNNGLKNFDEMKRERKETKDIMSNRLPDKLIEDILTKLQQEEDG